MAGLTMKSSIYQGSCWVFVFFFFFFFFCRCIVEANWKILKSSQHFIVVYLAPEFQRLDVDAKQGDLKVNLMHPHESPNISNWPQSGDTCYILKANILCLISAHIPSTGRPYKTADVEYQNTLSPLLVLTYFKKTHDLKRLRHECSFTFSSFPCHFLTDLFNVEW